MEAAAGDADGYLVPPAFVSATVQVSQELLDDSAGMSDLIGKMLRGEIEFKPPEPPKRHRCLACWLVSLLPGHYRCSHGYPESGCEECGEC